MAGAGYKWVSCSPGVVPPNAVEAGHDCDGSKIYVGRTHYANDQLPCKIVPQRRQAYVCHNGKEYEVHSYEVMVETQRQWVKCNGMNIPGNAIPGGRTVTGETLYIGRAHHASSLCIGKVHPSHRCLYIPFGGNEISIKSFEILVEQ